MARHRHLTKEWAATAIWKYPLPRTTWTVGQTKWTWTRPAAPLAVSRTMTRCPATGQRSRCNNCWITSTIGVEPVWSKSTRKSERDRQMAASRRPNWRITYRRTDTRTFSVTITVGLCCRRSIANRIAIIFTLISSMGTSRRTRLSTLKGRCRKPRRISGDWFGSSIVSSSWWPPGSWKEAGRSVSNIGPAMSTAIWFLVISRSERYRLNRTMITPSVLWCWRMRR